MNTVTPVILPLTINVQFNDPETVRNNLDPYSPKSMTYHFVANADHPLNIQLVDVPFEHVLVSIYSPSGLFVSSLTFKSKLAYFHLPLLEESGLWKLVVTHFHPLNGNGLIALHQGEIHVNSTNMAFDFTSTASAATSSAPRWYKGDFHLHTHVSDGNESLEHLDELCNQSGLDFYTITDHNLAVRSLRDDKLPTHSMELTLDDNGHINFIGLTQPLDIHSLTKQAKTVHEAAELCIKAAKEQGALVSLNHPFNPHTGARYNFDITLFDTIEVCRPYREGKLSIDDAKSVKAFDELWSRGYRLFAVGGSDFHAKVRSEYIRPGKPITHFQANSLSSASVTTALKLGHSFITKDCEVEYQISQQQTGKPVLWGQAVDAHYPILFSGACQESVKWQLMINGKIATCVENSEAEFIFELSEGDFARIEARNEEGNLKVFFNPIYCGKPARHPIEWLPLKAHIESQLH
ncbi:CehA/McbA family metallohydrolase [Photobacterium satsumensis]|uniref:CehA/McbA family metallohydrolase n=1 Tax=Photobacterium satsumensis TaxID=2910239 RepID=UPI003D0DB63A